MRKGYKNIKNIREDYILLFTDGHQENRRLSAQELKLVIAAEVYPRVRGIKKLSAPARS